METGRELPAFSLYVYERELGECSHGNCKATHQVEGFTHTECDNPIYKEVGLCPNFSAPEGGVICMHSHKPITSKTEFIQKLETAQRKYPEHFKHFRIRGVL